MRVRNDIEKIEDEFGIALFQLGNVISGGTPIERAIDKVQENLKGTKIVEMFEVISLNMKKFGCTFEQALFDKASSTVHCHICGSKLAIPSGGKAKIKGKILEVVE